MRIFCFQNPSELFQLSSSSSSFQGFMCVIQTSVSLPFLYLMIMASAKILPEPLPFPLFSVSQTIFILNPNHGLYCICIGCKEGLLYLKDCLILNFIN